MATKNTMQAVIFKGKLHVEVEQRPIPKIQEPTDIIVKVRYTALCGRLVLIVSRILLV
jgi:threonine dehydrogenase-like Zn-dependent dehydrogenase